jgi:hypothetical protein
MDEEFLDGLMGEENGVGQVDPFVMGLWRAWKDVREKRSNFVQVRTSHHFLSGLNCDLCVSTSPFIWDSSGQIIYYTFPRRPWELCR